MGTVTPQDDHSRVLEIKSYVLSRLRDELASAPRGAQAQLAKKLGVSGAHLSNMLSPHPTRQPGEDFRRKVAAHWGLSYASLEAVALGEEPPSSAAHPVHPSDLPPLLASVLTEYVWLPELSHQLRSVVREQARQHARFGVRDLARDEWQKIVTGLEREALAHMARQRDDGERPTTPPRRSKRRAP